MQGQHGSGESHDDRRDHHCQLARGAAQSRLLRDIIPPLHAARRRWSVRPCRMVEVLKHPPGRVRQCTRVHCARVGKAHVQVTQARGRCAAQRWHFRLPQLELHVVVMRREEGAMNWFTRGYF